MASFGLTSAGLAAPPNLLIIVADDHRGGTLGVDGDPRRATPGVDALARQGVRFTNAFCNAPVCTASRQSFITGRLPHAVGVTQLNTVLPPKTVTLGTWLHDRGYDTAAIGKMHFNSRDRHGFVDRVDTPDWVEWLKGHPPAGGDRRRPWKPFQEPAAKWLNTEVTGAGLRTESMESTFFADRAADFLGARRDRPFALVVSFYDPHSPFRFPDDWPIRFHPRNFPAPTPTEAELRARPLVFKDLTPANARAIQAAYYTSLSFVDSQVGRVVAALDDAGHADDTVVVYLGDNGYMLGEHGRFEKHCFYDPAVRVPLVFRWPGRLPAGREVGGQVELVDLLPTLLELLAVKIPGDLHGRSLVPLLRGDPGAKGREVVFSEYLENEEAMARSDRYKLIVGTGSRKRLDGYETAEPLPGPYERLYDLRDDPAEDHDLASHPELAAVRATLTRALHDRLVSTRDGVEPVPDGLTELEAIHWCLVPRDVPTTARAPRFRRVGNDEPAMKQIRNGR